MTVSDIRILFVGPIKYFESDIDMFLVTWKDDTIIIIAVSVHDFVYYAEVRFLVMIPFSDKGSQICDTPLPGNR